MSYEKHKLTPLKMFFGKARELFDIEHIPLTSLDPVYQCGGIEVKVLRRRKVNYGISQFIRLDTSLESFTNDELFQYNNKVQENISSLLNQLNDMNIISSKISRIIQQRYQLEPIKLKKEPLDQNEIRQNIETKSIPKEQVKNIIEEYLETRPSYETIIEKYSTQEVPMNSQNKNEEK